MGRQRNKGRSNGRHITDVQSPNKKGGGKKKRDEKVTSSRRRKLEYAKFSKAPPTPDIGELSQALVEANNRLAAQARQEQMRRELEAIGWRSSAERSQF